MNVEKAKYVELHIFVEEFMEASSTFDGCRSGALQPELYGTRGSLLDGAWPENQPHYSASKLGRSLQAAFWRKSIRYPELSSMDAI